MASIAEQLAAAAITDPLTGSPSEEVWPKLPWANSRGTFSASGWKPPTWAAYPPTQSRGGAYYKSLLLSGGSAFAGLTIPTNYSETQGAEYRSFGVWLFTPAGEKAEGYQLRLRQASSGNGSPHLYKFTLVKYVAGEGEVLEETGEVSVETGGAFALAVLQGTLIMWRQRVAGGGWEQVGIEHRDSTFTSGYSAIDGNGSNPTLSNFFTGALVPEHQALSGVKLPSPYEPSTRLAISVLNPDGTSLARWGADEADAGDIPHGLSFSTSDPGGFKDASLALSRRIDQDFPDLKLLRDVLIYGPGERTAWEGRLQEIPRHQAEDFSINPTAVGHVAALDDDPSFKEIYVGRDLSEFVDLSAAWRLGWGASFAYQGFNVAQDSAEGRPAIMLEINGQWTSPIPTAAVMYDASAGCLIAALDYEYVVSDTNAKWLLQVGQADDDVPTNFKALTDLATGFKEGSGTLTPETPRRVLNVEWRYSEGGGGAGAQYRATLRRLVWFGAHGLTIRGERPNRGLYICDVIADVVRRVAPGLNFTTGNGGSIEPSTYICPHLVFREKIKGSDAVLAANAYHQRSWGVEDGKRFFWRSTETYRKRWRIRRSRGHGVDLLGPQAEAAINGVVASFTDPGGVSRMVGPLGCRTADYTTSLLEDTSPTNPVNEAGIERKWAELQLSFVTDDEGAAQVAYAWMRDKLLSAAARGSVVVTGLVEDENGVLFPAWYMRAGDSATVVDGDNIERRIIETTYDHDSRTASCNLDATPHKVEALMERMGVSLVGVAE